MTCGKNISFKANSAEIFSVGATDVKATDFILTPYTLTSVCTFSILFSVHFVRGW